jgi:hypothetical protein
VRRILTEPADYARDLSRSAAAAWRAFFFTAADPTPLGLARLLLGGLFVWDLAVLSLDLHDYLGSVGWIGPEAARAYRDQHTPMAWSFWFHVPDRWLGAAMAACLAVAVLFTLGLWTRVTAVLAWAVMVSTVRRAPVALFGFDQMMATWTFYLAVFGAGGQAVSLDRFLARYREARRGGGRPAHAGAPGPSVSANLTLRLLQLHLVLVYGSAGLAKLMGPEWWDGTAMEMIVLTPEFRRFDLRWLAGYPSLLAAATHAGLLLEISYPLLIWVRKLRPLLLAAVVLMHFGIDLTLGLTEFGLAMIAADLTFASGPWLRGLVTGRRQPSGVLRVDRDSYRHRALAALVVAADPDRIVRLEESVPVPGSPDPAVVLACADGRTFSGPDAVLRLARWLPLLWPLGLLGALPGMRFLLARSPFAALGGAPHGSAESLRHPSTSRRPATGRSPEPVGSPATR